jgi:hypothetical protein
MNKRNSSSRQQFEQAKLELSVMAATRQVMAQQKSWLAAR